MNDSKNTQTSTVNSGASTVRLFLNRLPNLKTEQTSDNFESTRINANTKTTSVF